MIDGQKLRKDKLALRDKLDSNELDEKSKIIEGKLLELDDIKKGMNIFVYVSFRSEVKTLSIIDNLFKLSKSVSVPITNVKEKRLDAIHINDVSEDLVPGYCGIPEPEKSLCINNIIKPENIDVVILPGSVFDERGGRFGYGGGFYDRFLEKNPRAVRIGLAFELQTVAEAPVKPHDELLDYIITEKRIIKAKRQ